MGPETQVYPTPATEALAEQNFYRAAGQFAQEYPKGQFMFSGIWDKVRGMPSSRERIAPLVEKVRSTKAFLAEVRGRMQTLPQANDDAYIAEVAQNIAINHIELGNEVFETASDATHTTGLMGETYRAYLRSDAFRLAGGAAIYLAANQFGWITGENAALANAAAIISAGSGLIDSTRRGFLEGTTRYLGGIPASIVDSVRRKASVQESMITGDLGHEQDQAFNGDNSLYGYSNAQSTLLEDDLRDQLTAGGIRRPQTVPLGSVTYAPEQRTVITPALESADETQAMVDARDAARGPRLVRTLLTTALTVGAINAYLSRPVICDVAENPDDSQESIDRFWRPDRLSMHGKGEAVAFERRYGEEFDKNNPRHQERAKLDRQEPNYQRRIDSVAQEIRQANPQLDWRDEDRFIKGDVNIPCPPAYKSAFRRIQTVVTNPRIPNVDIDMSGGVLRVSLR